MASKQMNTHAHKPTFFQQLFGWLSFSKKGNVQTRNGFNIFSPESTYIIQFGRTRKKRFSINNRLKFKL